MTKISANGMVVNMKNLANYDQGAAKASKYRLTCSSMQKLLKSSAHLVVGA